MAGVGGGVGTDTSLVVQWLRLQASTAGGMDSIPDHGTKIPHAKWLSQKIGKKTKKTLQWGCLTIMTVLILVKA